LIKVCKKYFYGLFVDDVTSRNVWSKLQAEAEDSREQWVQDKSLIHFIPQVERLAGTIG